MKLDNINLDIETAEIMIGGEKFILRAIYQLRGKWI